MPDSLSRRIARFACRDADGLISPSSRHHAQRAILDTLAVTVAGGRDDAVHRLEQAFDALPGGRCRSPWTGRRYAAADGAALYGMASHMYDYDDVSMLAVCHPSAPVLSALLAAQLDGRAAEAGNGHDFVVAFAVGTEAMIRLGQSMGFRHYELGFHATATLGVVGAVAAVARLARLDEGRTRHALAIAASMASGVRKNFGSMIKPLHVGLAAAGALRAVRMAVAGIEGAEEAFEANGYLRAYSGGQTDVFPGELAFGAPFALESPGFEQKRYPCCYMLHKMIEGTLHLRRKHGCSLEQVRRASVRMPKGGTQPLIHPFPRTGLNAKFSAPYAVVASLSDARIDLASFRDDAVLREALQVRLRDVIITEDEAEVPADTDLGRMPVTVSLELHDGRTLEHTVDASPGSPEDPLTLEQLRRKWVDCLMHGLPSISESIAADCFEQGLELDRQPNVDLWLKRIMGG